MFELLHQGPSGWNTACHNVVVRRQVESFWWYWKLGLPVLGCHLATCIARKRVLASTGRVTVTTRRLGWADAFLYCLKTWRVASVLTTSSFGVHCFHVGFGRYYATLCGIVTRRQNTRSWWHPFALQRVAQRRCRTMSNSSLYSMSSQTRNGVLLCLLLLLCVDQASSGKCLCVALSKNLSMSFLSFITI